MRGSLHTALFVGLLTACGAPPMAPAFASADSLRGDEAPAAAPEPSEPPPTPAAVEAPAPELAVTLEALKVEGMEAAPIQAALDKDLGLFDACFQDRVKAHPDTSGDLLVSLLFVAGERKSSSASFSGPDAGDYMSCGSAAGKKLELPIGADTERVYITFRIRPKPAGP